MIQEATYYEVICDKCGQRLELDEVVAWQSEDEAAEAVDYCNWQIADDGSVFCSHCIETEGIDYQEEEE